MTYQESGDGLLATDHQALVWMASLFSGAARDRMPRRNFSSQTGVKAANRDIRAIETHQACQKIRSVCYFEKCL